MNEGQSILICVLISIASSLFSALLGVSIVLDCIYGNESYGSLIAISALWIVGYIVGMIMLLYKCISND